MSVWIDPEMRAFEAQVKTDYDSQASPIHVPRHDRHAADENASMDSDDAGGPRRQRSLGLATLGALLFCALLLPAAWSQTAGKITGTVQDQTDAAVPGATVVLVNTATGVKQITKTSEEGAYTFPVVSVGHSRAVSALRRGFRKTPQSTPGHKWGTIGELAG